jgi:hypothetical protein
MIKPPKIPTVEKVLEALYIEDCHVTGMHDPVHTTKLICELQLRGLAHRVLKTFGIDLDFSVNASDKRRIKVVNQIPRQIDREGWFVYYVENELWDKVAELEAWEQHGVRATAAQVAALRKTIVARYRKKRKRGKR